MDISKYTSFFHDGSIMDIQHTKNKIEFSMTSAEMDYEDLQEDIALSKYDNIQGKLHIEGIKSIKVNDKPFFGTIKKKYEDAEICHFGMNQNKVEFQIKWN